MTAAHSKLPRWAPWGAFFTMALAALLSVPASAQDEFAQPDTPRFGISIRGAYWAPVHVETTGKPKLNDSTDANFGFDAALLWYPSSMVSVFARGYRAGLSFDEVELAEFDGLSPAGTTDSFMEMNGLDLGVNVYLSSIAGSGSTVHPFFSFAAGIVDWSVTQDGRGGEPHDILEQPLQDTDFTGALGFGLEYAFSDMIALEIDWQWRFFLTRDEAQWNFDEARWGTTHVWSFSPGLVVRF